MIQIVVGTDRPGSRTGTVAKLVHSYYQDLKVQSELLDLAKLSTPDLVGGHYTQGATGVVGVAVEKINQAEGVVIVVPEYNGSFPGALKLFIDYWKFPLTFAGRPFCLIGLGGRFGGLRAVEHLQQILSFRNGFILPQPVLLTNIHSSLKDGELNDPVAVDLLKLQAKSFAKFVHGLQGEGLHTHTRD